MSAPTPHRYVKMNGLGNEIVVLDLRDGASSLKPAEIKAVAENPKTAFDQMMVLYPPRTADTEAYVLIFNTDGSESSACGNGTRCIGWLERGLSGKTHFNFETRAGILAVSVKDMSAITVDMGEPRFGWDEIPLAEKFHDTRAIELQIGPIEKPVLHSPSVVNVGNPHVVFWVDRPVETYDLGRFGPLIENHPLFPERVNVSLAEVTSPTTMKIRTWERGTGLTRACGTAACASAVSAMRKKLTERKVTVTLPGGPLTIEWAPNNHILMTGPVEMEHEGILEAELAAAAKGQPCLVPEGRLP
ncbi:MULTISPECIES: diaminopimelate epimerase [Hyphomicrobium]|uniref:diaminopimelate epimerase n=1 Tax=Hyphomicrobium TaxID=81 RepID=UPI00058F880E|nr:MULTISPECIES: diaminopimelate epimerase [Hyphomicrobium]WBT38646.1 diaminopimelate epimerase [Hyphomicrobium sp. DMF-1]HML42463.1 diaminopimelate epimerase [Hyphomicrobium zavarzinii]